MKYLLNVPLAVEDKFSPGPWRIEGENLKTAISSGHKHIAMVNYFNCGDGDPRSITPDEHKANARLIAAAPSMIRVLRWLNNEMDCRDDEFDGCIFTREDFQQIKDAIRLVEGRSR